MPQPNLQPLWLNIQPLPWSKAIRYTFSIGVPLILGYATGSLRYGVVALIGSMYIVNIANVDARSQDRLFAALVGAIVITGCAQLGGLLAVEQRWFPSPPANPPVELGQGWQRIRSGQTAGFRFACCYGLVPTIAFTSSLLLHLPRPFWTTATTLVVMKPDSRATVQRTVQRIVGTLIGVLVVEGIITWTTTPLLLIVWILLVAPLIPIGIARNYTLCCVAITVLVMVMIDLLTLQQGGDRALLPVRFVATLIGSLLTVMGAALTYPNLWRGQE